MGHKLSKIPSEALNDDRGPQVKHLPSTSKRSRPASAVDDGDLHSTSEKGKESSLQLLASADAEALQPAKLSTMNCAEEDDHSTEAVQSSEQVDMTKPPHKPHSIKASAVLRNISWLRPQFRPLTLPVKPTTDVPKGTIPQPRSKLLARPTLHVLQSLLVSHSSPGNLQSVLECFTPSPQDISRFLRNFGIDEELLQDVAACDVEALKLLLLIHAGTSNTSEISETPDCGLPEDATVENKLNALGDFVGPEREKVKEAAQALTDQVDGLLSLSMQKIQETGNNKSLEEALMQLCDCQATICRAAFLALAYQVSTKIVTKNELSSQLNKALTDCIELQKETQEVRQLALDRSNQLIECLEKRDEYANDLIALKNQLADPHSSLYLRHKVKRLEQENVELPKLRARTRADQSQLDRLRHTNATLQGNADTTKKLSNDLGLLQNAHENLKRENNSLKKKASVTETQEVEEKLHKANSKNEELQSTINGLESKLRSMRTTMNTANYSSSLDANDTDAVTVTTDEAENNNMGLPKFQLSSKAFNSEAVRALNYINKLNGTVVKRASKISGGQAGMGWDAFGRLEQLMEWVTKEGRVATKLVMGMDGAKETKMESQGFPTLPLGKGPEQGGGKGKSGGGK